MLTITKSLFTILLLTLTTAASAADQGFSREGLPLPAFGLTPKGANVWKSATNWQDLVAQSNPTLTFNGRDMLWVNREDGQISFTLNRAYTAGDASPMWVLFKPDASAGVIPGLEGQYLREKATLGKDPKSDAGNWAIAVSQSKSSGTLYEIGWETRYPQGASLHHDGRRLFILHDKSGNWQFVGEGPGDSFDANTSITQDYRVRWTGQSAKPIIVKITTHEARFHDGEKADASGDYPDLDIWKDGEISGRLPAAVQWTREYVIAQPNDDVPNIALRLAVWRCNYHALSGTVQAHLLHGLAKAIERANPPLEKFLPAKGDKISLPSATEFDQLVTKATAPISEAQASLP
ncbi:MAG TPA: hypothetical protein VIL86_07680 [Tepidisphaeraceae bacterium]|jgi:hypothetical protein